MSNLNSTSSVAARVITAPRQGCYWLLTIPVGSIGDMKTMTLAEFHPDLIWLKGQEEIGTTTGYHHWQVVACFRIKKTLKQVKEIFGVQSHAELCKSAAADQYVHKDDTSVPGSRFEKGLNFYDYNT